jgi:hypothetical protein
MAIEDVPEMLLTGFDSNKPFEFNERGTNPFSGKFLVFGGAESRRYIFSSEDPVSHSELMRRYGELIEEVYRAGQDQVFPLDGGKIDIENGRIMVHGESKTFGKYSEKEVRPIVERWRQQNLPNHELVFE